MTFSQSRLAGEGEGLLVDEALVVEPDLVGELAVLEDRLESGFLASFALLIEQVVEARSLVKEQSG